MITKQCKRGGWKIFMKSINVEAGFCFCGGWNFSKLVIVDSTFIREMRVSFLLQDLMQVPCISMWQ